MVLFNRFPHLSKDDLRMLGMLKQNDSMGIFVIHQSAQDTFISRFNHTGADPYPRSPEQRARAKRALERAIRDICPVPNTPPQSSNDLTSQALAPHGTLAILELLRLGHMRPASPTKSSSTGQKSGRRSAHLESIAHMAFLTAYVIFPTPADIENREALPASVKDILTNLGAWVSAEFAKRVEEEYESDMSVQAIEVTGDKWDMYIAYVDVGKGSQRGESYGVRFIGQFDLGSTTTILASCRTTGRRKLHP